MLYIWTQKEGPYRGLIKEKKGERHKETSIFSNIRGERWRERERKREKLGWTFDVSGP